MTTIKTIFQNRTHIKRIRFLLLLLVFIGCGNSNESKEELTIATAANMQFAMKDLIQNFTNKTGIPCRMVTGSSGKLMAQIKEGAPYHVFVSADIKYANELYANGLTENAPKIYANGKLVLWSMVDDLKPSIKLLNSPKVEHIAMANPVIAPYGKATKEVLEHYQLISLVTDKLVYGESISQTNQFIISEAAAIGLTSLSVVLSPHMKNKGKWVLIDETAYTPIEQSIVTIKNEKTNAKAEKFYAFLFSKEGKTILKKYGYSVDF